MTLFVGLLCLLWSGSALSQEIALTECPATISIGDVGHGVAVEDQATGTGWFLWSEENVRTRFNPTPFPQNASHLIAVRLNGSQWEFDNNGGWNDFTPNPTDCLIASVDFTRDAVVLMQGSNSYVNGINAGFDNGDIQITPNRWNGQSNSGEFGVSGTTLTTSNNPSVIEPAPLSDTQCPASIAIGDLGNGIAAIDSATGEGWVLWSEESVFTRFNPAPYPNNAKHLIAVKHDGTNWLVDNNSGYSVFEPAATDCLLAQLNFTTDTVTLLNGMDQVVEGIDSGYRVGDLAIEANRWANSPNNGEFGITGTVVSQDSSSGRNRNRNGNGNGNGNGNNDRMFV